jgi:phosphoribosylanthranilate isomerase
VSPPATSADGAGADPARRGGGAPVLVKICGLTRLEDALAAVRLGADWLGFNFWPRSKRYLAPAAAAEIIRALPPAVMPVGVFVDPTAEELAEAVRVSGIRTAQLHGDETPAFCVAAPVPVVKGIRVEDAHSLAALAAYEVAGFLLDSATAGYGGSGVAFDWTLAAEAAASAPIWLAGGLVPENVAEAVRRVRPLGVDVASGVESAPGVKDARKMEAFIRNAKAA